MVATPAVVAYYNTTFGASFSPDGKFLACGNRYGSMIVFNLRHVIRSSESENNTAALKPFKFSVCDGPIYALENVGDLLCCGSYSGDIFIYRWKDVIERRPKFVSILRSGNIPPSPTCPFEINALAFDTKKANCLYAAGGDCFVYCWDLEASKIRSQWKEHTDYIHCLTVHKGGMILSGGEDGCVKCYDDRMQRSVATMEPHVSECQRTEVGKWIGCLSTYEDWMICGGGVALGLWYLGSFNLLKPLESGGCTEWSAASVQEEFFLTGGSDGHAHRWTFSGDFLEKKRTACSCIYDIACTNAEPNKDLIVCCGSGSKICVYNYFGHGGTLLDSC